MIMGMVKDMELGTARGSAMPPARPGRPARPATDPPVDRAADPAVDTAVGPAAAERPAANRPTIDLEWLPDGVIVVDDQHRVHAVNARACSLVGAQPGELLGQPVEQVLPLQDLEGRRWWTCIDAWDGLPTRTGHPETLLVLPGDRELFVTGRYIRDGRAGPVRQVVVTLRDAETRRRAELKNSALISTVAHELRSPLTAVKGFTSTLLRRWDRFTDDQKRLMLQTIEADTDRVTRLIAELLDVSRIDSGRLEIRRQPIDLPAIVAAHVERLGATGIDRARFVLSGAPSAAELPELWADPDRIDQVVANLLENAVRHGAGTVTVAVDGRPDHGTAGEVVMTVSDEGDGIPEENYPMVFTRFWHGSTRSGTGLGLYVVRGLVEAHGGTITVGRGPAGGAEFRFTLPAGAPDYAA